MDKQHRTIVSINLFVLLLCVVNLLLPDPQVYAQEIVTVTTIPTVVEGKSEYVKPLVYAPVRPVTDHVEEPQWWVTSDEYSDSLGNAMTITNFLLYKFDAEVGWLQDNYVDGWPFGPVINTNPLEVSEVVAVAIAANSWRECSCRPDTVQNGGWDIHGMTQQQLIDKLKDLGTTSGKAWGIIQWDGGRRLNFVSFCEASGYDPRSLEVQLHYLAYEAYCSTERSAYNTVLSRYNEVEMSLDTVTRCAESYRVLVERGGTEGITGRILLNWGNRWNYAWGEKPDGGWYDYALTNIA